MEGVGGDDADDQNDGEEVAVGAGNGERPGLAGRLPGAGAAHQHGGNHQQQQQHRYQNPELDAVGVDGNPQAPVGRVGDHHQPHGHGGRPLGRAGEHAHGVGDGYHFGGDEYADDENDGHRNGDKGNRAETVLDVLGDRVAVGHQLADARADEHEHDGNAGHAQRITHQRDDAEVGARLARAHQDPGAEHGRHQGGDAHVGGRVIAGDGVVLDALATSPPGVGQAQDEENGTGDYQSYDAQSGVQHEDPRCSSTAAVQMAHVQQKTAGFSTLAAN